MLTREQTQNNEMIAKFLGGIVREAWHVEGFPSQMVWEGNEAAIYREAFMGRPLGKTILSEEMKFHESWDWLMPVLDKIRKDSWLKIEFHEDYTYCLISSPQLGAEPVTLEERLEDMPAIKVVWDAIVTYINWYNEQVKSKTV